MYSPSAVDFLILVAARNGDLERLEVIKDRIGVDVFRKICNLVNDCNGQRVLHYAAQTGHIEMCKFLIEEVKVEIDVKTARGETPLLHAALGDVNVAKYLIGHGADVATSDAEGYTSLHHAVSQEDDKELIQLLHTKGADIEANSVRGTPLQLAAFCGSVETLLFLLSHGAKPNSACLLFRSPLIDAIISHSSECVRLLLKAGADPNKSSYGLSPLAHAAAGGETKILKSLLAAGANPNSLSTDRLRPIEHAASARNHNVVRILLPVTQRIPNYPNWSVNGIMEYFHSEEAEKMRELMRNDYVNLAEQKGKDAWRRQAYSSAVKWYSKAIYLDPSNSKMLSNRSLCWERLGEATFALYDAEVCVRLRPDWAKAHYREGAAWKLRRNYRMSALAFEKAKNLDPRNDEIGIAYREAFATLFRDIAENYPLEELSIFELPWIGQNSCESFRGKFFLDHIMNME